MKEEELIFGLRKEGVGWSIRLTTLLALIIVVWTIVIPHIQSNLSSIAFLINETLESGSSPEFKLILLFVSFWLTCVFVSVGIKIYEKVWEFTGKSLLNPSKVQETEQTLSIKNK